MNFRFDIKQEKEKPQRIHDSGDKNCYQFLFKLLSSHYSDQIWDQTHKQLSFNTPGKNGDKAKVHWKSVFQCILREAFRTSPEDKAWQTLLKLQEIVNNPNQFMTYQGREIIKWKDPIKGKESFMKKCREQISSNIFSMIRSGIDNSGLPVLAKNAYLASLESLHNPYNNPWDFNLNRREEDSTEMNDYGSIYEEAEYGSKPSKKLNTGTVDFTLTSAPLNSVAETENPHLNLMTHNSLSEGIKNISIGEEEKGNNQIKDPKDLEIQHLKQMLQFKDVEIQNLKKMIEHFEKKQKKEGNNLDYINPTHIAENEEHPIFRDFNDEYLG